MRKWRNKIERKTPCYIVVREDRHCDTTVHPFTDKETAIAEARKAAKRYNKYPEDYQEKHIDGWLFYARYTCEDDSVRVVEVKMDEAI